ncbi:MAG: cation:proton antiporter [Candidatus Aenigmarchaeota archaeon]|nr:cation:proton antiporter [Candidatus Aenigmarchaeota archaeon]
MTNISEAFIAETLMQLVVILASAKIMGLVFEKVGHPKVLGELVTGLIIGPSVLGFVDVHNEIILFIAELGVIVLLFEVGVETKVRELMNSGRSSILVALLGIFVPLLFGMLYILAFTGYGIIVAFFIGATLTATSVGLTISVLSEIKKTKSKEGKIILGAAVIDDVIGLLLLSVLADIVSTGQIIPLNIVKTFLMSAAFLGLLVLAGKVFEKRILSFVNKIRVERTFIVTAFVFALLMSYISLSIGLATIIGAFAAGLILERKEHMKLIHHRVHVLTQLFSPVFFVMAGAVVDVRSLLNIEILPLVIVLTMIAFSGKMISGLGAYRDKVSKTAVGLGMLPRGEVGLIFANFGLISNIVTQEVYSSLIAVIMITTFIAPPLLKRAMK